MGSYSASQGIEHIRRHVAEYIAKRDGHPARWQDICLSAGASTAIKNCLQLFCKEIDGKKSGEYRHADTQTNISNSIKLYLSAP